MPMKRSLLYTFLVCLIVSIHTNGQIGINTTNPEEDLHIAGSNSLLLIDGFNDTNNTNNNGTNSNTRIFADTNGDFVLGDASDNFFLAVNSDNYLDDVENPTSLVNQTGNSFGYTSAGNPSDAIGSVFRLTRNAIVEINYSLSWSLYDASASPSKRIDDSRARVIQTGIYLRRVTNLFNPLSGPAVTHDLDGVAINGGPWCIDLNSSGTVCHETGGLLGISGQFYNNSDRRNGAYQNFTNRGTDYVKLGPGYYIAQFAAQVAVGVTSGSGASKMYLGSGDDNLQIAVHYYR